MSAIRAAAADTIERHLVASGAKFRVRDRAEGAALELDHYGLLAGGNPRTGSGTAAEKTSAQLQCQYGWAVAEQITSDLAAAGLLRDDTDEYDQPQASYHR
jgi:hypothetical protein